MIKPICRLVMVAVVGSVLAGQSWAVTNTWTGLGGDKTWETAANWSLGHAPARNEVALLGSAAPDYINVLGQGRCLTLLITKPGDIMLQRDPSSGDSWVGSTTDTTLIIDPSDGQSHTVSWGDIPAAHRMTMISSDATSNPTMDVRGNSIFALNSWWAQNAPGYTKIGTGTLRIGTNFQNFCQWYIPSVLNVNEGVIDDQSSSVYLAGASAGSRMNIAAGAVVQLERDASMDGLITFAGNGKIVMNTKLDGTGTPSQMNSTGKSWSPGMVNGQAGKLSIVGNTVFTIQSSRYNKLTMDITGSGDVAGADFDQLSIAGSVLGLGTADLLVNVASGLDVAGKSYTLLTSSNNLSTQTIHSLTVTGTPQLYAVSALPGGGQGLQIRFGSLVPGDANRDGKVDFADYVSLELGFGYSGGWAEGDFNGDGRVNFKDYIILEAHFGQSSSVPEPATLGLLAFGGGCHALLRRLWKGRLRGAAR